MEPFTREAVTLDTLRNTQHQLQRFSSAIEAHVQGGGELSDTPDNAKTVRDVQWLAEALISKVKALRLSDRRPRR